LTTEKQWRRSKSSAQKVTITHLVRDVFDSSVLRNDAHDASLWWRRLYDVTALLRLKKCGCKILEKVKFSQTDDPSAISDLAYSTATYGVGLHAKFRCRT